MLLTSVGRASMRRLAGRVILPRLPAHASTPLVSRTKLKLLFPRTFTSTSSVSAAAAGGTKRVRAGTTRAKTTKARKPAAKKKRPAAKKAKPKKKAAKPRKVLTDVEKRRLDVKALRSLALLSQPRKLPETAWTVFISQQLKGGLGGADFSSRTKAASLSFRALGGMELQRLQTTADQNKIANTATHKAWLESHPVEDIYAANRARARLTRRYAQSHRPLRDERLPKRPPTAYSLFTKARHGTGEFKGISVADAGRTLGREWKSLRDGERQGYLDLAEAEKNRYKSEVAKVFGRS